MLETGHYDIINSEEQNNMERLIDARIDKWIKESDKALLIYGARQIGKTYSIREALKRNSEDYFEINFFENPDFLSAISKCSTASQLIDTIRLLSPKPLQKNNVIFFDEVQLYPEIVTKIKFLVDEGTYRYILSGSMLGVELKGLKSMPVGYVEMIKMYPMDLYEFSRALGVKKETWEYLRLCFKEKKQVQEVIHKDMMRVFRYYLVTGGMPDAIKTFVQTKNLNSVYEFQTNIINQYKADFSKYELQNRKLKLIAIYDNIPSQLNKQNNRFIFTYLNKELKFDRYENSFLWLKDAGVALPIYIANQLQSPLETSKEKNVFKLFLSDVGLLTSTFPLSIRRTIASEDDNEVNKGSLYEAFVAEELFAHDFVPYYYKSTKIGEIDFLLELERNILAMEIKSGKEYQKHKSLDNLINTQKDDKMRYIVFSNYNIESNNQITNYPIYMVDFLKKPFFEDGHISIDIGAL